MDRPEPSPKVEGVAVSPMLLEWIKANQWLSELDKGQITSIITDRCKYGMEKYGQQLMTHDGRDDVIDALQEMGDLLQYAFKAKLNGRLEELNTFLRPSIVALLLLLSGKP